MRTLVRTKSSVRPRVRRSTGLLRKTSFAGIDKFKAYRVSIPGNQLTVKILCQVLDISPMTVYAWRRQTNGLPVETSPRGAGRSILLNAVEVKAWLTVNKPDYLPLWERFESNSLPMQ